MKRVVLVVVIFCFTSAFGANLVRESSQGCQIEVPSVIDEETFLWTGKCKDGKASGAGALTSSHGGYLQGEFRSGEILDASGRWPMKMRNGAFLLVTSRYSKTAQYISHALLPPDLQHFSAIDSDPLVGRWHLESMDGTCHELHSYQRSGVTATESGGEKLTKAYVLLRSDQEPSAYAILSTVVATNHKPDCHGNLAEEGRTAIQAVEMVDRNTLLFCRLPDHANCEARLVRTGE